MGMGVELEWNRIGIRKEFEMGMEWNGIEEELESE